MNARDGQAGNILDFTIVCSMATNESKWTVDLVFIDCPLHVSTENG